ncbi:unnamed protein product [Amoebophrya sp. A120]|nr:unnamed protein product [Amoebophrya sp. A120]|eukprot:GSA120T00024327001.1
MQGITISTRRTALLLLHGCAVVVHAVLQEQFVDDNAQLDHEQNLLAVTPDGGLELLLGESSSTEQLRNELHTTRATESTDELPLEGQEGSYHEERARGSQPPDIFTAPPSNEELSIAHESFLEQATTQARQATTHNQAQSQNQQQQESKEQISIGRESKEMHQLVMEQEQQKNKVSTKVEQQTRLLHLEKQKHLQKQKWMFDWRWNRAIEKSIQGNAEKARRKLEKLEKERNRPSSDQLLQFLELDQGNLTSLAAFDREMGEEMAGRSGDHEQSTLDSTAHGTNLVEANNKENNETTSSASPGLLAPASSADIVADFSAVVMGNLKPFLHDVVPAALEKFKNQRKKLQKLESKVSRALKALEGLDFNDLNEAESKSNLQTMKTAAAMMTKKLVDAASKVRDYLKKKIRNLREVVGRNSTSDHGSAGEEHQIVSPAVGEEGLSSTNFQVDDEVVFKADLKEDDDGNSSVPGRGKSSVEKSKTFHPGGTVSSDTTTSSTKNQCSDRFLRIWKISRVNEEQHTVDLRSTGGIIMRLGDSTSPERAVEDEYVNYIERSVNTTQLIQKHLVQQEQQTLPIRVQGLAEAAGVAFDHPSATLWNHVSKLVPRFDNGQTLLKENDEVVGLFFGDGSNTDKSNKVHSLDDDDEYSSWLANDVGSLKMAEVLDLVRAKNFSGIKIRRKNSPVEKNGGGGKEGAGASSSPGPELMQKDPEVEEKLVFFRDLISRKIYSSLRSRTSTTGGAAEPDVHASGGDGAKVAVETEVNLNLQAVGILFGVEVWKTEKQKAKASSPRTSSKRTTFTVRGQTIPIAIGARKARTAGAAEKEQEAVVSTTGLSVCSSTSQFVPRGSRLLSVTDGRNETHDAKAVEEKIQRYLSAAARKRTKFEKIFKSKAAGDDMKNKNVESAGAHDKAPGGGSAAEDGNKVKSFYYDVGEVLPHVMPAPLLLNFETVRYTYPGELEELMEEEDGDEAAQEQVPSSSAKDDQQKFLTMADQAMKSYFSMEDLLDSAHTLDEGGEQASQAVVPLQPGNNSLSTSSHTPTSASPAPAAFMELVHRARSRRAMISQRSKARAKKQPKYRELADTSTSDNFYHWLKEIPLRLFGMITTDPAVKIQAGDGSSQLQVQAAYVGADWFLWMVLIFFLLGFLIFPQFWAGLPLFGSILGKMGLAHSAGLSGYLPFWGKFLITIFGDLFGLVNCMGCCWSWWTLCGRTTSYKDLNWQGDDKPLATTSVESRVWERVRNGFGFGGLGLMGSTYYTGGKDGLYDAPEDDY